MPQPGRLSLPLLGSVRRPRVRPVACGPGIALPLEQGIVLTSPGVRLPPNANSFRIPGLLV